MRAQPALHAIGVLRDMHTCARRRANVAGAAASDPAGGAAQSAAAITGRHRSHHRQAPACRRTLRRPVDQVHRVDARGRVHRQPRIHALHVSQELRRVQQPTHRHRLVKRHRLVERHWITKRHRIVERQHRIVHGVTEPERLPCCVLEVQWACCRAMSLRSSFYYFLKLLLIHCIHLGAQSRCRSHRDSQSVAGRSAQKREIRNGMLRKLPLSRSRGIREPRKRVNRARELLVTYVARSLNIPTVTTARYSQIFPHHKNRREGSCNTEAATQDGTAVPR